MTAPNFDPNKIVEDHENILSRLDKIEAVIEPLIPIIPRLQEMFSREVAGVGATAVEGITIPADEIGKYDPVTGVVADGQTNNV